MIQKLKQKLLILSSLLMFLLPAAVPLTVSAQTTCTGGGDCIKNGLCKGAQDLDVTQGTKKCNEEGTSFTAVLRKIVNILSVLIGVIAVIMIIIGGFRYITSAGSADRVKAAQQTILYAVIGLVIVALAQVIVRFVLTNTINTAP
jgi:hypothetical protein